ncbi:MAG: hypothetical protein AB8I08_05315 [Sandaracinaceae bacterium]
MTRRAAFVLTLLFSIGCDTSGTLDASMRDASDHRDAGRFNAGTTDAGTADGGLDAGASDAGHDAGSADAGGSDAGPPCSAFETVASPPDAPPFTGTAFITDDFLTDADPSSFIDLTYTGQGVRTMFDRRPAAFIELNAHLFDARFGGAVTVEIQVNPEFTRDQAETEARFYAAAIGRIPAFLFRDIDTVWIHAGMEAFGGGNRNLLIHTERGESHVARGSLEEIFLHEASHTSMDAYHKSDPRWLDAQAADGVALSTYARDNPTREDVAETVGPYLAARFGGSRISAERRAAILDTVPNRVRYLDCLGLTMDLVP